MGWAKRRDANESDLVAVARKIGLKVFYTNELGDLVVQFGGNAGMPVTELWEVKTEKGKLTVPQLKRMQAGLKARIVRTVDDVLEAKRQMMERLK